MTVVFNIKGTLVFFFIGSLKRNDFMTVVFNIKGQLVMLYWKFEKE